MSAEENESHITNESSAIQCFLLHLIIATIIFPWRLLHFHFGVKLSFPPIYIVVCRGQVCPSCRAFFRRSVQSRYNETFKCTKGCGECAVTLMTRKNCQFCRYQKCIAAGMRPSWILSDEERVRRFHGRGKAGSVKGSVCSPASSPGRPEPRPSPTATTIAQPVDMEVCVKEEDWSDSGPSSPPPDPYSQTASCDVELARLGAVMANCFTGRRDDIPEPLLTEMLQVTLHGTPLSAQAAAALHTIIESRGRTCLAALPDFQALCTEDQAAIAEHNLPLVHRFRQAVCLASGRLDWRALVEIFVGPETVQEEAHNLPCDLSGSPKKTFDYGELFRAPWCPSREVEQLHRALVEDIAAWVDHTDHTQLVLLVCILAFNHDFLDLQDRAAVERVQLKFVLLLQARLRATHPGPLAASKLAKAIMLPAVTRQIQQLTKKRLII